VGIADLVGRRFGRLVVVSRSVANKWSQACWLCRCDCGTDVTVPHYRLRHGGAKSCGCARREAASRVAATNGRAVTTHGMSQAPEYSVWLGMKTRCYNSGDHSFSNYGGRGISICERWLHSFENFYVDMGPRPNSYYQIDRINNDGNYESENCRWVFPTINRRNQRILTQMCLLDEG